MEKEKDFWPILDVSFPMSIIPKNMRMQSAKVVRYADGKWTYEADSTRGITIKVKCGCGKEHSINLGSELYVDPPRDEKGIIDVEVEDVSIEEPTE